MAVNAVAKGSFQPDNDVHITYEDQQKINKFARQNARLEDLKDELKGKEKQLQNLEDASEELMLLDGEDVSVPYQLGEVFVSQSLDETQALLEDTKEKLKNDIGVLKTQCESIKSVMSDLKVQLYAKFGNNINLDAEDD